MSAGVCVSVLIPVVWLPMCLYPHGPMSLHPSLPLLDPTLLFLSPVPLCLATPTVDGKWQAWASWGGCSVTCGGGSQRRERLCSGPFFGGAACQGPQDEYRQCGTQRCPGETPLTPSMLGSGKIWEWLGGSGLH
jgi:hypothetical protein